MIKTVIADDSAFLREVLRDVLSERGIEVVGVAKNGKEAVELVKDAKPDILILDCEMPVMNGLEALSVIMDENPLPVFMFSSLTREGASVTIKALELGAVDFLLKPMGGAHSIESVADELVQKLRFIVLKSKFGSMRKKGDKIDSGPSKGLLQTVPERRIDIIAMGSSTGGVQAAGEIVPKLPADTKPMVWVQHMPPNFTKSFAERLNSFSKMRVYEAKDGDVLAQGICYLAPGGQQMRVYKSGGKVRLKVGGTEKVSGHCPSCNVLFSSVAENYGDNAMGIILTGMGDDGAQGLAQMHSKGAYVIGQDERSCVVYGMPKAAYGLGAVDIQVNLKDIPAVVIKAAGVRDSEAGGR